MAGIAFDPDCPEQAASDAMDAIANSVINLLFKFAPWLVGAAKKKVPSQDLGTSERFLRQFYGASLVAVYTYRVDREGLARGRKALPMEDVLDSYLLESRPSKAQVVEALIGTSPVPAVAGPYIEGLRLLRDRTPDLALVALRLALAGKTVGDGSVIDLRNLAERARKGEPDAAQAYRAALA
jgi:hypothetical protein